MCKCSLCSSSMITTKVLATGSIRSARRSPLKACAQGSLSNVKNYAPQLYTTAGIDKRAVPPLKSAIAATFQTLMDFGLRINHPMDKIGSPLTVAIQRQDVEMVRFLLSKGADANDQYWISNDTVLARAKSHPSLEILTLLLEHGAKI